METVQKEISRILLLLRSKIKERGFTQLEVQEALGWGRSYISQLLTKQKTLRVDQVLLILNVIGVDPGDFYSELYPQMGSLTPHRPPASVSTEYQSFLDSVEELRAVMHGLIDVLVSNQLISREELSGAVTASDQAPIKIPLD